MKVRKKNKLCCIEKNDLEKFNVKAFFKDYPFELIYVLNKGILEGIITLGDYKKYKKNVCRFYNRKFRSLYQSETELAERIFEEKKDIHRIPIIDDKGHIKGEYVRHDIDKVKLKQKNILETVQPKIPETDLDEFIEFIKLCEITKILFVQAEDTLKLAVDLIQSCAIKKGVICSEISSENIIYFFNEKRINSRDVLIADMGVDIELNYMREKIYKKNCIQVFSLEMLKMLLFDPRRSNYKNNWERSVWFLKGHYSSIAIIGENQIANKFYICGGGGKYFGLILRKLCMMKIMIFMNTIMETLFLKWLFVVIFLALK